MKTLTKILVITCVFTVLGLTSCTKQDLQEDEQLIDKKELQETDV